MRVLGVPFKMETIEIANRIRKAIGFCSPSAFQKFCFQIEMRLEYGLELIEYNTWWHLIAYHVEDNILFIDVYDSLNDKMEVYSGPVSADILDRLLKYQEKSQEDEIMEDLSSCDLCFDNFFGNSEKCATCKSK